MSIFDNINLKESDVQNANAYNRTPNPPVGLGLYKVNLTGVKESKNPDSAGCPIFTLEVACEQHSNPSVSLTTTYGLIIMLPLQKTKIGMQLGRIKMCLAPLTGKDAASVSLQDIKACETNAYIHQGKLVVIETTEPAPAKNGNLYSNYIFHSVTPELVAKIKESNQRAVLGTPTVVAQSSAQNSTQNTPRPAVNATPAVAAESDPFDIF